MKTASLPDNESEIFQRCVEAIQNGQITIESCVAKYPQVSDLETTLQVVISLQHVAPLGLPQDSKQKLQQALLTKLPTYYPRAAKSPNLPARRSFFPATLVATLIVLLFGYLFWSQSHFSVMGLATEAATLSPTHESVVNVTATDVPSLETLRVMTQNCLTNKRFYNSFQSKLAKEQLNAFINEVKAQAGKKFEKTCALQLIDTATYLLTH